jgi:hypothetical protein
MGKRYKSKTFRKPAHWSNERYEQYLKDNNLKKCSLSVRTEQKEKA